MTSKHAIFFYSMSGNTKAILDYVDTAGFDVINLTHMKEEDLCFDCYDTILLGTSTMGKGVPPLKFKEFSDKLIRLQGKTVGLFGSGNSVYPYFCGALDILHDVLSRRNDIRMLFRFEEYPSSVAIRDFQDLFAQYRRDIGLDDKQKPSQ